MYLSVFLTCFVVVVAFVFDSSGTRVRGPRRAVARMAPVAPMARTVTRLQPAAVPVATLRQPMLPQQHASPVRQHQYKRPALLIRLARSGMEHIQDFAIQLFEEKMRNAKWTVATDGTSFMGKTFDRVDVEVVDLKPAERYSIKFQGGTVPAVDMSIEKFDLHVKLKPHLRQKFLLHLIYEPDMLIEADAKGVDVTVRFLINFTIPNVIAQLAVSYCQVSFASLKIVLHNGGAFKNILDSVTSLFDRAVRKKVGAKVCQTIRTMVADQANNYLRQIPTKMPIFPAPHAPPPSLRYGSQGRTVTYPLPSQSQSLRSVRQRPVKPFARRWQPRRRRSTNAVMPPEQLSPALPASSHQTPPEGPTIPPPATSQVQLAVWQLPQNLLPTDRVPRRRRSSVASSTDKVELAQNVRLDYSIVEPPVITSEYIETRHSGEVSWQGRGSTPVQNHPPHSHAGISPSSSAMLSCLLHDYVFNTLLYTMWTRNYFHFVFNRTTAPEMARFLAVDCDVSFECMGALLPVLQERFSGYYLQVTFQATRPPFVVLYNGVVQMHMNGPMTMDVSRGQRQYRIFGGQLSVVLDLHFRVNRQNLIVGNMTLSKFDVQSQHDHEKLMNLDEAKFVAYIWRAVLETTGNQLLEAGFRMPSLLGVTFLDTSLHHLTDTIRLDLDFVIDKSKINDLANQVMHLVKGSSRT